MAEAPVKICAYPWNAAAIRPGGAVLPCCVYNDQEQLNRFNSNVDILNVRNTIAWQDLRDQFILGQHPRGCSTCWHNEDLGVESLRQYGFNKFPIPKKKEESDLIMLEVSFSNLCNLACVHCSSYFSTRWQAEDVKHGRTSSKGIINISENSLDQWDLSRVRYLKIIGGEPLMEQEKFIRLLDRIHLSSCKIQICTNGTQEIRPELADRLVRAEAVLIAVSMDGIEGVNDWCRWPSRWDEQESRISEYDSIFSTSSNIYLHFHHCVSVFNVFYLKDTVNHILTRWPKWKIQWDWVDHPDWQSVAALPQIAKRRLTEQLSKDASDQPNERLCGVNPYKDTLHKMHNTIIVDWKDCVDNIQQLAVERQLDIHALIPRLAEYI